MFLYSGCFNLASDAYQLRYLPVHIYIYIYILILIRNHSTLPNIIFSLSPCLCITKSSSFIHGSCEKVANLAGPQLAKRNQKHNCKLPTCGTNILPPQAAVSCNSVPHSIQSRSISKPWVKHSSAKFIRGKGKP